jgi:WD40 repeat protein
MKHACTVVAGFALLGLGLFSATSAQETKAPAAEDAKALQEKFRSERDSLVKSGAAKRFLPILLDKAESMGKRGDDALAQGRFMQAIQLYRQARWQLPYQSANVPEKYVSRVLGNLRLRHGHDILDVAFSPDGKLLATASRDRTVKLWDMANGHELLTYTGHRDEVRRVAFHPSGKMIASAGAEKNIKLWDPASGKDIRTIEGKGEYVTSMAFSKDGKTLVVANNDKAVRLYDVDTGDLKRDLDKQFNGIVRSVAFSPDGALLAMGVDDSFVKVWQYPQILTADTAEYWAKQEDVKVSTSFVGFSPDSKVMVRIGPWDLKLYNTPQPGAAVFVAAPRRTIPDPPPAKEVDKFHYKFNCLVFSKDGQTIYTGGKDGLIRLWDSETGEAKGIFKGHNDEITSLVFNAHGSQLASASADYTVRIWNFDVVLQSREFVAHSEPAWSACFNADGSRYASASADKTVKVVDVSSGKVVHSLEHQAGVTVVAYSPDGKTIASGGGDKVIRVWDADSAKSVKNLEGHVGTITSLAFTTDGKKLASGSVDKRLKVWDYDGGKEIVNIDDLGTIPTAVVFSPNGKWLLCGNTDQTVRVYDAATGKPIAAWSAHGLAVTGLAISPNGQYVASCSADYLVRVWNFAQADGSLLPTLGAEPITLSGHQGPLSGVAFRKDNQHLVSCGSDMVVKLWKIEGSTAKEAQTYRGHKDWVTSVNFSKDGYFFLSTSVDRAVRIWEITDREIPLLAEHTGTVEGVAVSPDGKLIASGGTDKSIKVWDREKGVEVLTLQGHTEPIHALAFLDNKTLVSAAGDALTNRDNSVRLWDLTNGKELPRRAEHQENFHGLIKAIPYMVIASGEKKLIAWIPANRARDHRLTGLDLVSGKVLFELFDNKGGKNDREVVAVSFTPDGKKAATAAADGTVRLWDLDKKERAPGGDWVIFDKGTSPGDIAFTPDGNTLIASSEAGDIKILDVAKRTTLHTIAKAHTRAISVCLVSPDGKRFATAGQDNVIKVFDVATAKLLREWHTQANGRSALVTNMTFTPDSRQLVTANANTTLFVLDLP